MTGQVSLFLAFGAGFLSFISPCTLPIYPAFLSYITGFSVTELKGSDPRVMRRTMLHTFLFLVGFSIIFAALGYGTSIIGDVYHEYGDLLRRIGAILMVVFGLVILGIFQPKFLMKEKRLTLSSRPEGYIGSVFIGMAFAAGWMPCMGPIMVAVFGMSVSNPDMAPLYMLAYVVGFSIPFFILTFFISQVKRLQKYSGIFMKTGGIIMVITGVVLYFDWLTKIITQLKRLTGGFTGF